MNHPGFDPSATWASQRIVRVGVWSSTEKPAHVQPLVNFPRKVAPSKLVNALKGVSSKRMRRELPELPGSTGGPGLHGQARTLRDRLAEPQARSCAATQTTRSAGLTGATPEAVLRRQPEGRRMAPPFASRPTGSALAITLNLILSQLHCQGRCDSW